MDLDSHLLTACPEGVFPQTELVQIDPDLGSDVSFEPRRTGGRAGGLVGKRTAAHAFPRLSHRTVWLGYGSEAVSKTYRIFPATIFAISVTCGRFGWCESLQNSIVPKSGKFWKPPRVGSW